jgi:hypothetical protein
MNINLQISSKFQKTVYTMPFGEFKFDNLTIYHLSHIIFQNTFFNSPIKHCVKLLFKPLDYLKKLFRYLEFGHLKFDNFTILSFTLQSFQASFKRLAPHNQSVSELKCIFDNLEWN